MKNIFIAHTPYHIFLSLPFAKMLDSESHLIIANNLNGYNKFLDGIDDLKDSPFSSVHKIETENLNDSIFKILYSLFKCSLFFKGIVRKSAFPCNLFIFHDGFIFNQYLMNKNVANGGENIYVEDGSALYRNVNIEKFDILKYLLSYVFYQNKFEKTPSLGTHSTISRVYATYPELVRNEVKKEIVKICPSFFFNGEKTLIEYVKKKYILNHLNIIQYILILPLSSDITKSSQMMIQNIISWFIEKFEFVVIKYHPRETINYLTIESNNFGTIPKDIPLESYLIINKQFIKAIIGIYSESTSLMNSRIICGEDVKIVSTRLLFNLDLQFNKQIYNVLCIYKPSSLLELNEILNSELDFDT